MLWANFLHFYQPPDQKKFIMDRVVEESYRVIISILRQNPEARITMSVVGCLLVKLDNEGYRDVIDGLRELAEKRQIELTGGTMYHPFLPKLPDSEIFRQINLNNEVQQFYFKSAYKPSGFYSPEAGYSFRVAQTAYELGYKWTIVDEISYSGYLGQREYDYQHTPGFYSGGTDLRKIVGEVTGGRRNNLSTGLSTGQGKGKRQVVDYTKLYAIKGLKGFLVHFRERVISDAIASGQITTPEKFLRVLIPEMDDKRYLLTGTDGEAYGHHQWQLGHVLGQIYHKKALKTITVSDLTNFFPVGEEVEPIASTWGTSEKEVNDGNYYARWHHIDNQIHDKQWELTELAIGTVNGSAGKSPSVGSEEIPVSVKNGIARELLDEALYSCHYWWASARPWWSIELVERGARMLADVVAQAEGHTGGIREVEESGVIGGKSADALKLYQDIVFTAFDWLRSEKVADLSHKHK
jgi:hypothetical protein